MEIKTFKGKIHATGDVDKLVNKFLEEYSFPKQFVTIHPLLNGEDYLVVLSLKKPVDEPSAQEQRQEKVTISLHDGIGYNNKFKKGSINISVAKGKYETWTSEELEEAKWCVSYPKGSKDFYKIVKNGFKKEHSSSKTPDYFLSKINETFRDSGLYEDPEVMEM